MANDSTSTFKLVCGGVVDVPVTKLKDTTCRAKVSDMSEETIRNVFLHGLKQLGNDAASAIKADERDKVIEAVQKSLDRVSRNEWTPGKGGGGERLSPFDRELRSIAHARLRDLGLKDEAAKLSTEPSQAARRWALIRLAQANGNDPSKVSKAKADEGEKKVLAKWHAAARAALEAKADLDVEL